jgi:hypothetical protein
VFGVSEEVASGIPRAGARSTSFPPATPAVRAGTRLLALKDVALKTPGNDLGLLCWTVRPVMVRVYKCLLPDTTSQKRVARIDQVCKCKCASVPTASCTDVLTHSESLDAHLVRSECVRAPFARWDTCSHHLTTAPLKCNCQDASTLVQYLNGTENIPTSSAFQRQSRLCWSHWSLS